MFLKFNLLKKMHKIIKNKSSTISNHSHSCIRIRLCYPVDMSRMIFIPYYVIYMFFSVTKMCGNFHEGSMGVFLRGVSIYLPRVSEKTTENFERLGRQTYVSNPVPPVYQFRGKNHLATGGAH